MQQMGDENQNPRIMNGVIITVYVDHQTTTVRSLQTRRKNEGEKRFVDRRLKREIRTTRGYDRRADLLACIRQMRAESFSRDSQRDGGETDNNNNKPERPNPKKKKRRWWIRKMFSKFRLAFRRKNRRWRYCKFDHDEGEREANYNSNLWNKFTHMVGRLSRGCFTRRSRRRDS